jgi:hypothetical protein
MLPRANRLLRRAMLRGPKGHETERAVLDAEGPQRVFRRGGIEAGGAEPGCGGTAGSLDFERGHHKIVARISDRAVRAARDSTPVVIDLLLRVRIRAGMGRRPLHSAEPIRDVVRSIGSDRP